MAVHIRQRGIFNLLPLILPLASCTSSGEIASAVWTVRYICEDGEVLVARFRDQAVSVSYAEGIPADLPIGISGSGFAYTTTGATLRGKGDEVIWTEEGAEPITCVTD